MSINTIVPDPERIQSSIELEDIISRIVDYEKTSNCSAGVLLIQRKQFGAAYRIRSKKYDKFS